MQRNYYFLLLSFLFAITSQAQTNQKIRYKADSMVFLQQGNKKIRRLVDHVIFKQKTSTMYCDSSIFYVEDNLMEAYGNVKIVDDSVTITADRLVYNGANRTAQLRENVIYTKGEQRLTTNFLDYNMETEIGNYFNKGTLQDSTNTLKSEIGYFFGQQNYALFWEEVSLNAPAYDLFTDTLRYNTIPKIAITKGETEIITEDGVVLQAEGGEFKTENDQSQFIEGNVETEDYYLEGDKLFFDDLKKYYDAKGNVVMTAKDENIILYGDEGYVDKVNGTSKLYGNALMKRILEKDTFYLSADTLVSIESEYDSAKRILAYNNVKMWRFNLQGLADSVSYFLHDSLIYFYEDPIFWNLNNQISGDTIHMEITEDEIKNMKLNRNSFLVSEDTLDNHNQIKGRNMIAFFKDAYLDKIDVNGNGESIYYTLDDSDSTNISLMGMNRIICSDMTIRFKNQQLNNITFYIKPEGQFIPPHELTSEIQQLPGYEWRGGQRPELADLLGLKSQIIDEKEKTKTPKKPTMPTKLNLNKE